MNGISDCSPLTNTPGGIGNKDECNICLLYKWDDDQSLCKAGMYNKWLIN